MNNGSEQANELTHCSKFIFEAAFYAVTNIAAYGSQFSCPLGMGVIGGMPKYLE